MNLFAIIQNHVPEVRRIRTKRTLQKHLSMEFKKQRDEFFGESEMIDFDPRYKVDDDELFVIQKFDLPDFIDDAIANINQVDDLAITAKTRIKSIFATNYQSDGPGSLEVYFQGFMQRRLLVTGWTLLQTQDTYKRMKDPGLILDSSLVGVYKRGNSLFFRSYTLVSRFLNLSPYFVEATDADIREVLRDNKFHVDDESVILDLSDSVIRKRFMAVKASSILDRVKVKRAQTQANKFGLKINISGGKIVFPVEKKDAKELLRFLMEGYYEGPITGNKYITNSQRPV